MVIDYLFTYYAKLWFLVLIFSCVKLKLNSNNVVGLICVEELKTREMSSSNPFCSKVSCNEATYTKHLK